MSEIENRQVNKPLRVAAILGKLNSGGKKSLIMEYYRHMDKSQVQYDFICDSDSNSIPYEEIESMGGRVFCIRPYQNIFGNLSDMKAVFKENGYSVMHAFNSTMNFFPLLMAKKCGIPVRITESLSMAHEGDWKTALKSILKVTSKWNATHFMSCGQDCGRYQFGSKLFDEGKVDIFKTVVDSRSNAYDPALREKTRSDYGWDDKIIIGHIGRFTAQKNSVRLMKIFGAIAKLEPSAEFCLIGDGELKNEMMSEAERQGITDKLHYLGRREDIHQFYCAMDVFVLPSLYEGLPVVGLEAESCGLPMFFSTEVTKEADACPDLGHFIALSESDDIWAEEIIKAAKTNMPIRREHSAEVAAAGYDSASEALRLQNYYLDAASKTTI